MIPKAHGAGSRSITDMSAFDSSGLRQGPNRQINPEPYAEAVMDRIDVLGSKLRAMEAACLRRGEPAEFTLFVLDWSKFFRLLPTDLTEAGAVWGSFGQVAMIDVTASMGSRSSPAFACTLGRGFHQAFRDRLREVTPQQLCDMGTYVDDCAVICITRHADGGDNGWW